MVLRTFAGRFLIGKFSSGWTGFVLLAIFVFSLALSSCSVITPDQFTIIGGDEQLLVLMRNDQDGFYQVSYEGRDPAELQSLHVMMEGQTLHVDIIEVAVLQGENEVILAGDASVPAGSQVILEPGEEFTVRVTYRGQTLGGNYMYGFRIAHGDDPQAAPVDYPAEQDFVVVVE
jgi:hypothetical protein